MTERFFSRGFLGRRRSQDTALPPGQYLENGFPVLSAGPTPHTPLEQWDFSITGAISQERSWTWEQFLDLPVEDITDGKAWVTYRYDGDDLEPEHGGPARLLVPHLYFWKSAKWVRRL